MLYVHKGQNSETKYYTSCLKGDCAHRIINNYQNEMIGPISWTDPEGGGGAGGPPPSPGKSQVAIGFVKNLVHIHLEKQLDHSGPCYFSMEVLLFLCLIYTNVLGTSVTICT